MGEKPAGRPRINLIRGIVFPELAESELSAAPAATGSWLRVRQIEIEWDSLCTDDVAVQHPDRAGSRDTQMRKNLFRVFFQFRVDSNEHDRCVCRVFHTLSQKSIAGFPPKNTSLCKQPNRSPRLGCAAEENGTLVPHQDGALFAGMFLTRASPPNSIRRGFRCHPLSPVADHQSRASVRSRAR